MKSNRKLALAVLIGMAIGIAGATAIHARQMKMAPGYVIAEVDVTDGNTDALQWSLSHSRRQDCVC